MKSVSLPNLVTAACYASACLVQSSAFSIGVNNWSSPSRTSLRMVRGGDNPLNNGDLTSTLARLDRQWQIQQRAKGKKSRWTKIVLPKDDKETSLGEEAVQKDPFVGNPRGEIEDFVYLLEPESTIPSCLIVFVGGAGLGQFPQIAYNELLMRVSSRLNAAIITAPYQVGLNHFEIAKQTGERLRKAMIYCEDDSSKQYPSSLPTYCLAHSLGAKLQTIYMAATGQEYDGVGYMSFNNFSFSQTIAMAKTFAQQLRGSQGPGPSPINSEALNSIFDFAETAIGALGFDFSPKSDDMERLIELKYNQKLQSKTRLFVFDQDNLDSSRNFVERCPDGKLSVSGLPGNHLTPVYFKFGLQDIPEEARSVASGAMGGIDSASFGNEEELAALVDEICGWILGKNPSRGPDWEAQVAASDYDRRLAPGQATDH